MPGRMVLECGDGDGLDGGLTRRVLGVAAVDRAQVVGPDAELRRDADQDSGGQYVVGADHGCSVIDSDGSADKL